MAGQGEYPANGTGKEECMKVAMMQPAFLPWQGFFALIQAADVFVFLDDFQFSIQSYHQRNRLLVSPDVADWYTVPVNKKEAFKKPLCQVLPSAASNWQVKMQKRIVQSYGKTPYFATVYPLFERNFTQHCSLAEMNMGFIRDVCALLGWEKEIVCSSAMQIAGSRTEKIINILETMHATQYLSAQGACEYMKEDKYPEKTSIPVQFLDYAINEYPQYGTTTFISHLSILDALFNIGPQETCALVKASTNWKKWNEIQ